LTLWGPRQASGWWRVAPVTDRPAQETHRLEYAKEPGWTPGFLLAFLPPKSLCRNLRVIAELTEYYLYSHSGCEAIDLFFQDDRVIERIILELPN
jgi:hypothetical protein